MSDAAKSTDPFVAMVTAKAEVDLRLSDFHPRSMLVAPEHEIRRPKFPVIDYHNHLDAQEPREVLRVMDGCGIEKIVNITMYTKRRWPSSTGSIRRIAIDLRRMDGWTGATWKRRDFSSGVLSGWNDWWTAERAG